MTPSCNLLIHLTFRDQIKAVINSYPSTKKSQIERQITTTLCEIKANPTYGARLRYITNEKLKGAIRKTYVGGREGHRLIYIYNPQKSLIIPVHLTSELRRDIDYRKTLWEQITDEIYNDYINKKHNKFVNWK